MARVKIYDLSKFRSSVVTVQIRKGKFVHTWFSVNSKFKFICLFVCLFVVNRNKFHVLCGSRLDLTQPPPPTHTHFQFSSDFNTVMIKCGPQHGNLLFYVYFSFVRYSVYIIFRVVFHLSPVKRSWLWFMRHELCRCLPT